MVFPMEPINYCTLDLVLIYPVPILSSPRLCIQRLFTYHINLLIPSWCALPTRNPSLGINSSHYFLQLAFSCATRGWSIRSLKLWEGPWNLTSSIKARDELIALIKTKHDNHPVCPRSVVNSIERTVKVKCM